jgi:hypothetical protein
MRHEPISKQRTLSVFESARRLLCDPAFAVLHRVRPKDFTRECKLTFVIVSLMILQKSLKSLQVRLHEFMASWFQAGNRYLQVTGGAFTHARAKLSPSVFSELNRQAVLSNVYGTQYQELVQRWRGHRLLGTDGSLLRLPSSQELFGQFGEVAIVNQHGKHDRYPQARISVLYDLLNGLALDGQLDSSSVGEIDLARKHLGLVQPLDVIITDRGFTGYRWFVECVQHGHFISRCSLGSFAVVQELMEADEAGISRTVTLQAPADQVAELKGLGLPLELRVRFVTLRLKTGELEVLATSLLDEQAYPTDCFGEVYWNRWGIETFYGRLKGRLDLENFSGQTVAAVHQDFQAMLFLSNLESVVCSSAQERLEQPSAFERKNPAQINRAVSLHALKYRLIELLASNVALEQVLTEVEQWFRHNPVSVRKERKVPRRKLSALRSYHFQRRIRKIVF